MHKNLMTFNNAFLHLYLDKLVVTPFYTLTFSSPSHSWDVVHSLYLPEGKEHAMIETIEKEVAKEQNFCHFWLTKDDFPSSLPSILEEHGYELSGTDIFMFLQKYQALSIQNLDATISIEQVTTKEHLEAFIQIFKDVHGDVNEVVCGVYRRKLFSPAFKDKTKAFILYVDHVPVTIGACSSFQESAIIHSIATLPEYRNKGFATAIVSHLINSIEEQNILLSTEQANPAQNIYKKFGFTICGDIQIYGKYLQYL